MNLWNGFYQIQEENDCFLISMHVPGIREDELSIRLESNGRILCIAGGSIMAKRRSLERRVFLPGPADPEGVSARLFNGILIATAAKAKRGPQSFILENHVKN